MDENFVMWPKLYGQTSDGGVKEWQVFVCTDEKHNCVAIKTVHGKLNGKLTEQVKLVKTGKNIGKANETTPWEQACSEAKSAFQQKLDKNYQMEMPNGEKKNLLPMLAHKFIERKHDIVYPAFVQPKFNGVRCLATRVSPTHIEFTSRGGKSYNDVCQHLVPELLQIMNIDDIFDGELYHHDWTFQKITRTVKKLRPWGGELQYHVYDLACPGIEYERRLDALTKKFVTTPLAHPHVLINTTHLILSEAEVKVYHDKFIFEGYEGVIIRNKKGFYKFDHRSADLQKYKEFIDQEFTIVGFNGYQVEDKNAIIFSCDAGNGKEFNVVPKGSIPQRIKWYNEGKKFIHKILTVRYFELSEDGIPIMPVGIAVRDYE